MMKRYSFVFPILAALALSSCSSKDKTAANAAADADTAFQQGRNGAALQSIHRALSIRDDVSDYWLLLGRISTAEKDMAGAFAAYENVIKLDRSNVEALRLLCQLGLVVGAPDKVDKYADQLLLLTPDDPLPVVSKGGAALERGDEAGALKLADSVLAKAPSDSNALILKARVFAARQQYGDAARLLETSLGQGGDDTSRLDYLKALYTQAHDISGYQSTLQRLAAKKTKDTDIQLEFADMLYQQGKSGEANATIISLMQQHPDDIGLAAKILDVWLRQGPSALSLGQLREQSAKASLEMKSAYAQFANELGHPEIALAILPAEIRAADPTFGNTDAKSALAYATGLDGRYAEAIAQLDAILEFDNAQPRALLARARLLAATNKIPDAIADARLAVANDPHNASARLALADFLIRQGDQDLAQAALREGLRANPKDTRLASRLAISLGQSGDASGAKDVLNQLADNDPVSLRAARLATGNGGRAQ